MGSIRHLSAALALAVALTAAPARAVDDEATFTVVTRLTESGFDPALHYGTFDAVDVVNLYDPLVLPSASGLPRPHLATGWEASEDGSAWTFSLRDDVTFHDGRRLTAADVVYSMDRMLTIQKGYAYLWDGLLAVGDTKALDAHTVRFELARPFGPFVETLVQFFVVNSELLREHTAAEGAYGEHGDYGTAYLEEHDAGSGAYALEAVVPDTQRSYARYDDYFQGWQDNQFERVVVQIVGESAAARELLSSGAADMVDQWQPVEFYRSLADEPGVVVRETVDSKVYAVQMNTAKPPLDDPKFRQAIAHAFDYDTAVQAVLGGAERARGPIPSTMAAFDPATPAPQQDLATARRLLAESRYDPKEFELTYAYQKSGAHEPIGLLLRASLAPLGIKVVLAAEPWPTLVGNAAAPDTAPHFFPVYVAAKTPSADHHTYGMYHPASHGDWQAASHYGNAEVTRLLDRARATTDAHARNALYAQAEKAIVADAPALWIAYPSRRVALRERIEGYAYFGLIGFDLRVYDLSYR